MFAKSSIHTKLDEKIMSSLAQLDQLQTDTEEYGVVVDRIAKLHKLKSEEATIEFKTLEVTHKIEADSRIEPPSLDTVLVVCANLFGIIWLTRYERENVISSKSLGFVMKPRS